MIDGQFVSAVGENITAYVKDGEVRPHTQGQLC